MSILTLFLLCACTPIVQWNNSLSLFTARLVLNNISMKSFPLSMGTTRPPALIIKAYESVETDVINMILIASNFYILRICPFLKPTKLLEMSVGRVYRLTLTKYVAVSVRFTDLFPSVPRVASCNGETCPIDSAPKDKARRECHSHVPTCLWESSLAQLTSHLIPIYSVLRTDLFPSRPRVASCNGQTCPIVNSRLVSFGSRV